MFLWSDDVQDGNGKPLNPSWSDNPLNDTATGASAASQKGVYDGIANSYPNPHLVLAHSVHATSK